MNENFLQENPLQLFDDFVLIPEETFNNGQDLAEITALVDTICESDDYARVIEKMYEIHPKGIKESIKTLESYVSDAEKGVYGEGKKKEQIIFFINRALATINEIIKYNGVFKHKNVKIAKCHPDAILPKYKDYGDAGADIYTVEHVTIKPGETIFIRTGLKIAVPGGYKLEIIPRSGLSATTSLRIPNSPGTIDSGFREELKIIAQNTGNEDIVFTKNTRIAQMILVPIVKMDWIELEEEKFNEMTTERGAGFGSSGLH